MEEFNLIDPPGFTSRTSSKGKQVAIITGIIVAAVVVIVVFAFIAIFLLDDGVAAKPYLTYDNYQKIQTGMTYGEVVDILDGHQGDLVVSSDFEEYTSSTYSWTSDSGFSCIVVSFFGGEVISKSQYGLD